MTNLLLNQSEHLKEIVQFLRDHRADLTYTPEITAAILPTLETKIKAAFEKDTMAQPQSSMDIENNKEQLRASLQENAYHVAMGLAAYADDTDDFLLQNMVDFPFAEIQTFRDIRLQRFGLTVYTKATEPTIANVLAANYNVSEKDLTELLNNVRNYGAVMFRSSTQPDAEGLQNKMPGRNMDIIHDQLDKLRRIMRTYRKTNRPFFDMWEGIYAQNMAAVV